VLEQYKPHPARRCGADPRDGREVGTGEIDTADRLAIAEIEISRQGQALAFALTILALGAAIVFFAIHNVVAGVAFTSVPVVMLIRSFLRRSDSSS
jgi:hypothetical protein